jgi:hypothetical protein
MPRDDISASAALQSIVSVLEQCYVFICDPPANGETERENSMRLKLLGQLRLQLGEDHPLLRNRSGS